MNRFNIGDRVRVTGILAEAVQRFQAISDCRAAARLSKSVSPGLRMFDSVLSLTIWVSAIASRSLALS